MADSKPITLNDLEAELHHLLKEVAGLEDRLAVTRAPTLCVEEKRAVRVMGWGMRNRLFGGLYAAKQMLVDALLNVENFKKAIRQNRSIPTGKLT